MPLAVPRAFLAAMIAAGLLNLALPVAVAFWARRRLDLRWAWIGFGALGFLISQPLVHIPLVAVAKRFWLGDSVFALMVFASITAGLCEETARWVLLRRAFREHTFRSGFGYGVGHGGLEALLIGGFGMLLGAVQVVALAKLDPGTLPLSPDKLEAVQQAKAQLAQIVQGGWYVPLASVWERVWALALQIAFSLCVLRAVVSGKPRWWVSAVLLHGAVDLVSVFALQRWGALGAESFVTLFGLCALAFILHEWQRSKRPSTPVPAS